MYSVGADVTKRFSVFRYSLGSIFYFAFTEMKEEVFSKPLHLCLKKNTQSQLYSVGRLDSSTEIAARLSFTANLAKLWCGTTRH